MLKKISKENALFFLETEPIGYSNIIGLLKNKEKVTIWTDNKDKPNGIFIIDGYFRYLCAKEPLFAYEIKKRCSKLKQYVGFSSVLENAANIILEGEECDWRNTCYLYYYEGNHCEVMENIKVRELTEEDAEIVNHYYTYRSKWSLQDIKDCIEKRPAYGYVENGELVSWLLVHEDDSMGIMYTKEGYRKKGIAKLLTEYVTAAQLERGMLPYLHIIKDNEASIKLAESSGFKRYGVVEWFGLKRKITV